MNISVIYDSTAKFDFEWEFLCKLPIYCMGVHVCLGEVLVLAQNHVCLFISVKVSSETTQLP